MLMPSKLPSKAGSSMSALSQLETSADITATLYNFFSRVRATNGPVAESLSREKWSHWQGPFHIADFRQSESQTHASLTNHSCLIRQCGQ
jgi:hypothetical protein